MDGVERAVGWLACWLAVWLLQLKMMTTKTTETNMYECHTKFGMSLFFVLVIRDQHTRIGQLMQHFSKCTICVAWLRTDATLLCIHWNSILCEFVHFFRFILTLSIYFFLFLYLFFPSSGVCVYAVCEFYPFPQYCIFQQQWHILHFTYFVMSTLELFSLFLSLLNWQRWMMPKCYLLRSNIVIFSNQKQISFWLWFWFCFALLPLTSAHFAIVTLHDALICVWVCFFLFLYNFHLHKCHKLSFMPNACRAKMKMKIGRTC